MYYSPSSIEAVILGNYEALCLQYDRCETVEQQRILLIEIKKWQVLLDRYGITTEEKRIDNKWRNS